MTASKTPGTHYADPESPSPQSLVPATEVLPPVRPWRTLTHDESLIWDEIVSTRAQSEWTGIDIHLAVEICHCLVKIREFEEVLEDAAYLQFVGTANERAHPYINVVTRMWQRVIQLQSRLGITPFVGSGDVEKKGVQRTRQKLAEQADDVTEDNSELIPRSPLAAVTKLKSGGIPYSNKLFDA